MKRASISTIVLGSTVVSLAMAYPTELAAGDKSSRGASVSASGVSVSAGPGGASVSAGRGGASVSADRGGASASADRGGASASAERGGASASADRGSASASADRGSATASADRGGATASADRGGATASADRGGASASADRGGASVSASRDGASVSAGLDGASVGVDRGDTDVSGGRTRALPADRPQVDRSHKSYGSIGEWFEDLRTSWFGGRSSGSEEATTVRSSAIQSSETSQTTGRQVNRVVQEKSSVATATDGGSAVAESRNVNVTEQKK